MRLTAIEKLARRMCWVEFVGYRPPQREARYWLELPADTRKDYMNQARYFVVMLSKLGGQQTSLQMVRAAQLECCQSWGKK